MARIGLMCTLVALSAILAAGCGGDGKKTVSGTVTFEGKPLPTGEIIMRDDKGNPDVAEIKDGRYSIVTSPGAKTVEITSIQETGKTDPLGGPEKANVIPEKYNTATELKINIPADSPNFDLK